MKKKLEKNEKVLQLSEEEMKVITDDQNKQEAELDRIVGSLEEIRQAGNQKFGSAVQSRVDRLSELLKNLKLLTSQSETISLIKTHLGLD